MLVSTIFMNSQMRKNLIPIADRLLNICLYILFVFSLLWNKKKRGYLFGHQVSEQNLKFLKEVHDPCVFPYFHEDMALMSQKHSVLLLLTWWDSKCWNWRGFCFLVSDHTRLAIYAFYIPQGGLPHLNNFNLETLVKKRRAISQIGSQDNGQTFLCWPSSIQQSYCAHRRANYDRISVFTLGNFSSMTRALGIPRLPHLV